MADSSRPAPTTIVTYQLVGKQLVKMLHAQPGPGVAAIQNVGIGDHYTKVEVKYVFVKHLALDEVTGPPGPRLP